MSGRLDIITLRGLSARGHHGVFSFEREGTQPFSVDLALYVDTRCAAAADDINQTVSYADIAEETVAVLVGPSVYLLETLAQRIAEAALSHPRVEGVEVTIHKPMAPLNQQFSDVTVTIQRGRTEVADDDLSAEDVLAARDLDGGSEVEAGPEPLPEPEASAGHASSHVVLALGGNIGDAPTTVTRAVAGLVELDELEVDEVSPLVRTTPVLAAGQEAQADYWNAIVLARTTLSPEDLLAATSAIETRLGRVRHERWGARTIDIDLVQFEGVTSTDPALTLPHPRAHERAFVLVPWVLADPEAVLEGVGRVDTLAAHAPDRGGILDAVSGWLEDPTSVIAESDEVLGRTPTSEAATAADAPTNDAESDEVPPASTQRERVAHSRLDLVPDVSRRDLSPTDTGEDYLWRSLWERWRAPLPEGAAAEDPVASTEADLHPVEAPVDLVPEKTAGAESASGDGSSGRGSGPAHVAQPGSERRGHTSWWVPVHGGAARHEAPAPQTPELPAWSFSGSDDVRIIDDPQDLAPVVDRPGDASTGRENRATASGPGSAAASTSASIEESGTGPDRVPGSTSPESVTRRSVLDPHLPPHTPTGPIERDETTQTSIIRGLTVRPTVTGHRPVTRRGTRGQP